MPGPAHLFESPTHMQAKILSKISNFNPAITTVYRDLNGTLEKLMSKNNTKKGGPCNTILSPGDLLTGEYLSRFDVISTYKKYQESNVMISW